MGLVVQFPPRKQSFGFRQLYLNVDAKNPRWDDIVSMFEGDVITFWSQSYGDVHFDLYEGELIGEIVSIDPSPAREMLIDNSLCVRLYRRVYIHHAPGRIQRVEYVRIYFIGGRANSWAAADGPDT